MPARFDIEKDERLMRVHKEKTNELVLKHFGSLADCPPDRTGQLKESELEGFKCA